MVIRNRILKKSNKSDLNQKNLFKSNKSDFLDLKKK